VTNTNTLAVDTMLESLKRWVRRKEGNDVEVLHSQVVEDVSGKPEALNVLVTSSDSDLSIQQIRTDLLEVCKEEQRLKEHSREAYERGDVAEVNRMIGELIQIRGDFIRAESVVTYKLGLRQNNPPVLALWPGLPPEFVYEEKALQVAVEKIGESAEIDGLVHYRAMSTLIRFRNSKGDIVFIDPLNSREVPIENLAADNVPQMTTLNREREQRIASQWEEFLRP